MGTKVLESTVSRYFNHAFTIRCGLCVPNLVPFDKFWSGNVEKAWEYLSYLNMISPQCGKYGDEKSLKGKVIYNKKARRDVLTGIIPHTLMDSDLRNTYSIIGMCTYSETVSPCVIELLIQQWMLICFQRRLKKQLYCDDG